MMGYGMEYGQAAAAQGQYNEAQGQYSMAQSGQVRGAVKSVLKIISSFSEMNITISIC